MSLNETAPLLDRDANALDTATQTLTGHINRIIAKLWHLQSVLGTWGCVSVAFGIVLSFGGAALVIAQGMSPVLALMAGYCTLVASVVLAAALHMVKRAAPAMPQAAPTAQPNFPAWKLVSVMNISDASRLWCEVEPGSAATQESTAWAFAMLDAVKTGALPIQLRSGAIAESGDREKSNPTWHTRISRKALQDWARAHGHVPRFLQD